MAEGAKYNVEKLNGQNYESWNYLVKMLLTNGELWDIVSSAVPEAEAQDNTWKKKNDKALSTIALLVDVSQLVHIRNKEYAHDAWEALRDYHQKSSLSSMVFLLKRICKLSLEENGDMEAHISLFLELLNKLAALGEEIKDRFAAGILLGSLPDSYSFLITALESKSSNEFTLEFVKSKLIDEYRRRQGASSNQGDSAMKSVYKGDKNTPAKSSGAKQCYFCNRKGHFKRDCFKYKAFKEKANKVTEDTNDMCFMVNLNSVDVNKDSASWYVDSGASSHMVNYKEFYTQFDGSRKGVVRLAGKGQHSQVQGIGTGFIKCANSAGVNELKIDDVLCVPQLDSNLLSVKKLTSAGYNVQFDNNECKIILHGKMIASARPAPDLYKLSTVDQALSVINEHSKDCQHTWHRRFGHRDIGAVKNLMEAKMATGINIKDCMIRETCSCCVKGKIIRKSFPKFSQCNTHDILDLIHTDVCGPMKTVTPGGKRYILTLIDDFSRYTFVYLLNHKNETVKYIKEFVELMSNQSGRVPKVFRSDRGGEYVNNTLREFLKGKGIKIQYTAGYSPEQNGVAERKNRSLVEMARCMLIDADLSNKFWGEAIVTANYLQNRLPTKSKQKTPFELWHKVKPDVSTLQIFGSKVYSHIPKELIKNKFDKKAETLVFVGYSDESKAYRLLDVDTGRIKISRSVVFPERSVNTKKVKSEEVSIEFEKENEITDFENTEEIQETTENSNGESDTEINYDTDLSYQPSEGEPDIEDVGGRTRSTRINKGVPPERYSAKLAELQEMEPKNFREVFARKDSENWQEAMKEEIKSLKNNETWSLVSPPEGKNIISCKWVYKLKQSEDKTSNKYKARLVARGFSQKFGVDYDEVFAPVVRQATLRILLTEAWSQNLIIRHLDAKTAFLNGELTEEIYMDQPEGFEEGKGLVCRLNKSLYGLKQSARTWNLKLNEILTKGNFEKSNIDACLYTKTVNDQRVYIIIYVDDILIAAKDNQVVDKLEEYLKNHFEISSLGLLKNYLGIKFERSDQGIYSLNQADYIDKLLNKFGMKDAKDSNIPLDVGYYKLDRLKPMKNSEIYQRLIGGLLYVAINTRPDILSSITILSQHNKDPKEVDWNEAKRVLRYLKKTKYKRLVLGERGLDSVLYGYADADWAEDKENRKSNSGYIFLFRGAPINWGCRKQSCVSLSSTEAEYIALGEGCQEAIWLKQAIKEFVSYEPKIVMYEDNQSCLKQLASHKFSNRTKHIDTKYHFVKELYENRVIDFQYCPTEDMIADMLTKPLSRVKLEYLSTRSGLFD